MSCTHEMNELHEIKITISLKNITHFVWRLCLVFMSIKPILEGCLSIKNNASSIFDWEIKSLEYKRVSSFKHIDVHTCVIPEEM